MSINSACSYRSAMLRPSTRPVSVRSIRSFCGRRICAEILLPNPAKRLSRTLGRVGRCDHFRQAHLKEPAENAMNINQPEQKSSSVRHRPGICPVRYQPRYSRKPYRDKNHRCPYPPLFLPHQGPSGRFVHGLPRHQRQI